jgi:hypothetical protein
MDPMDEFKAAYAQYQGKTPQANDKPDDKAGGKRKHNSSP